MSSHSKPRSTAILIPETLPEHGLGHITRMLGLRRELLGQGTFTEPDLTFGLYAATLEQRPEVRALLRSQGVPTDSILQIDSISSRTPQSVACDIVVFDRRVLERSFVEFILNKLSTGTAQRPVLLGIDAVGSGAELCDYVIDGFPRLNGLPGNEQHTAFISSAAVASPGTGSNSTSGASEVQRILITLGGAGDAERELPLLRALQRTVTGPAEVHIYGTDSADRTSTYQNMNSDALRVHQHGFDPGLSQRLGEFDLVLTHFGLTAYEAAAAGCAVLLVNPGRYHQQLSRHAGFDTLPQGRLAHRRWIRILGDLLRNPEALRTRTAEVLSPAGRSTAQVVQDLMRYRTERTVTMNDPHISASPAHCPVCSADSSSLLYRFPAKNYSRCKSCGVLFMHRATAHGIRYNTEYFFREYEKQYGKSYLEDFHHIKGMGKKRLRHILSLLNGSIGSPGTQASGSTPPISAAEYNFTALDIGCAYGPFMAAVQEVGALCFGIDVAEDAVRHVVHQLGFQAACIPVQELNADTQFGRNCFDVVTMWYVIEHFDRLGPVLKKIAGIVAPNGVFAFSTPNGAGISARRNRKQFLHNSPADHFTVWEPDGAAAILGRYGFHVERIVITGHHPERFPIVGRWAGLAPLGWILTQISRVLALGDTFEVYARRVQ